MIDVSDRTPTGDSDTFGEDETARPRRRTVRIARTNAGSPIGAALFVTPRELSALGIDPATTNTVTLHVTNGQIKLTTADPN